MKILVGLWHPAHVHTFRNVIKDLQNKGHQFKILVIDKDIVTELLNLYSFDYEIIGESPENISIKKGLELIKLQLRVISVANNFEPDLLLSRSISPMLPVKKLHEVPLIIFDDTEFTSPITPFLYGDYIFTPENCKCHVKNKMHVKLPTYKELAYLHPNNFQFDNSDLSKFGIDSDEKYALIRFADWNAWHDTGLQGFNREKKRTLVNELKQFGKVYITSETPLRDLKEYEIDIPPHRIFDLMAKADLFIGEGGTMPAEAALLGTPSVRFSPFVGKNVQSHFNELENKYNIIYNFEAPDKAIKKSVKLFKDSNVKERWEKNRDELLEDKIDLSAFLVEFINNYPESVDLIDEYIEGN